MCVLQSAVFYQHISEAVFAILYSFYYYRSLPSITWWLGILPEHAAQIKGVNETASLKIYTVMNSAGAQNESAFLTSLQQNLDVLIGCKITSLSHPDRYQVKPLQTGKDLLTSKDKAYTIDLPRGTCISQSLVVHRVNHIYNSLNIYHTCLSTTRSSIASKCTCLYIHS